MKKSHRVWFQHHGVLPDWKGKREVIHHKDGNKRNNAIENLELMTQGKHVKHHNPRLGTVDTMETRKKLAAAKVGNQNRKGVQHTAETKAKISAGSKRSWARPEMKTFIQQRQRDKKGTFK
jgi:hypothetical protein